MGASLAKVIGILMSFNTTKLVLNGHCCKPSTFRQQKKENKLDDRESNVATEAAAASSSKLTCEKWERKCETTASTYDKLPFHVYKPKEWYD